MKTRTLMVVCCLIFIGCNSINEAGAGLPDVVTDSVTLVSQTAVLCSVKILSNGGDGIINRGVCWNRSGLPTLADSMNYDGTGEDGFSSFVCELEPGTTYYIRAYASNSTGVGYGNTLSFKTNSGAQSLNGTVKDICNNVYNTIKIGSQTWMAGNLRTTKYRNGNNITNITSEFARYKSAAYCNYDNKTGNGLDYGRLYNYYAMVDNRKIAPVGWHVATYNDWMALIQYAGGMDSAGYKLKEANSYFWDIHSKSTNEFGFTARGGGYRSGLDGSSNALDAHGRWWAAQSTGMPGGFDQGFYFGMTYAYPGVYNSHTEDMAGHMGINAAFGLSVRCVQD